ncbi:MAG: TolC family outer membrane protein, partial [Pseudomonadota bacterium]
RGGLFPKVDLRGETGYEYLDSPSTRNRTTRGPGKSRYTSLWRNSASVFVTQMIFDGFQTVNLVRSARARAVQAGHRIANTRQTVALEAIAAYLDVVRTREFVRLARRNVRAHAGILGGIVRLQRQGRTTRADIGQARARYFQATARLKSFQGELRRAIVRYQAVVGRTPSARIKQPGMAVLRPRYARMTLQQAYKVADKQNPENKAAQSEVKARRYALDATKGLFTPRVDLEVEGSLGNNLDGSRGHSANLTALIVLTWNLYRGGSDIARRREALANLTVSQYDAADSRRVVRQRLGQAYEAFATDRATIPDNINRVRSNRGLVGAYARQFLAGQRSLLDRLDVQNDLFLAELELANNRSRLFFNYFSFVAATGELLPYFGLRKDIAAKKSKRGGAG